MKFRAAVFRDAPAAVRWLAALVVASLLRSPAALAQENLDLTRSPASQTGVARLRGVVEEIRLFARALDRSSLAGTRSDAERQRLLDTLLGFERGLSGLKADARFSFRQIEAEIARVKERPASAVHMSRDVLFHLQDRRRQLDAGGPWNAERPIDGARRSTRHRRAQAFARLFLQELLDRELEGFEAKSERDSALGGARFSVRSVRERLEAFFRTIELALPRAIAAVRTGGTRFWESVGDLAILGQTPGELAGAVDRVHEAMLRVVRLQVDWIESAADRAGATNLETTEKPNTEKRSRHEIPENAADQE